MVPSIHIHEDADGDLNRLYEADATAAGQIVALLEELDGNFDLLDRLTQHNFGIPSRSRFHVSRWQGQWNSGRNLWRLKMWEEPAKGHRIVYAFEPSTQRHVVLAIVPRREFNYEPDEVIAERIFRAYDALPDA